HRGAFRAQGPLQIINLDAHFDLRTADVPTSGTPFKQISELVGREDFDYSVLGISRPNNTPVLFHEASALGVTVVLDEDLL
ncbi:arginase family protein, partial [Streptococcus anginosus]|nr:arginase family protein [Streptococcus anginosus]